MKSSKNSDDLFITQNAKVKFNSTDGTPPSSRKFLRDDEVYQALEGSEKSQGTQLLQKTQENLEAQQELQNKRKEFHAQMQNIKEREKVLQQRRIEFNEQVTKFAKFMNDNEEKRNRANRRAAEEIKLRESLENDIKAKIAQIEQLRIQKEQSREALEANELYQKYLQTVVESTEDFTHLNDLLDRHATLQEANLLLRKTSEDLLANFDDLRAELSTLVKEKQNEVLVLNSQIVEKKQRLEASQARVSSRQLDLSQNINSLHQRSRTMGEIEMAIGNLYNRLQLRRPRTDLSPIEQLDTVKEVLLDTKVCEDIINGNVGQTSKASKELKSSTKKT